MTIGKGKRPSGQKRDFMQVARGIVEQAIGEQMDGNPLPKPAPDTRNPHAVALGSMGGRKGGRSRAKSLSPAKPASARDSRGNPSQPRHNTVGERHDSPPVCLLSMT